MQNIKENDNKNIQIMKENFYLIEKDIKNNISLLKN